MSLEPRPGGQRRFKKAPRNILSSRRRAPSRRTQHPTGLLPPPKPHPPPPEMTGSDLFLRAHTGVPVLTMAFPSCLHVPGRSRRSSAFPLAAAKAGVVGRVRSGGYAAVQKRRRSDVQEVRPFSRVVTKRDAVDEDEEDVQAEAQEFDAAESGDVDGSYLSETRYCCTPCFTVLKFELQNSHILYGRTPLLYFLLLL
jgi:hypothetical protein